MSHEDSKTSSSSRAAEILVFTFASSFFLAVIHFGSQFAWDTSLTWLCVTVPSFSLAYLWRCERLKTPPAAWFEENMTPNNTRLACGAFAVEAFVAGALAVVHADGLGPKSKWMLFIAAMMGLKWSVLFLKAVERFRAEREANSRALLSPIGEIA